MGWVKNKIPILIIACLVLWYAGNNYLWDRVDTVPAYNDQAHHLTNQLVIVHHWQSLFTNDAFPRDKSSVDYPLLYYLCAALWALLFGDSPIVAININLLFYAIILVSVYAAGKKAFNGRIGIAACLLLSLYPYIYGATRVFILEFAVCAFAALCVCLLYYSQGFFNFRFTLAAAVVCLLGMLTKQTFFIYVIGPALYALAMARGKKELLRRGMIFLGVGFILPAAFYVLFFYPETRYLFQRHIMDAALFSPADPWKRNLYYFWLLVDQLGWPSLLLFAASFVEYLRVKSKDKLFFLSWLLVPFSVLQCAILKNSKYSLPILPVIALLSAWGIYRLKQKPLRYAVGGAIAMFGLLLHYVLLFHTAIPRVMQRLKNSPLIPRESYAEYGHLSKQGNLEDVQREIFRMLGEHAPAGQSVRIGITDDSVSLDAVHPWAPSERRMAPDSFIVVNEWGMKYFSMRHRLPYKIYPLSFAKSKKEYDLLVTVCPLSNAIPVSAQEYTMCGQITVPSDKSMIYCYVHNAPALSAPELYFQ